MGEKKALKVRPIKLVKIRPLRICATCQASNCCIHLSDTYVIQVLVSPVLAGLAVSIGVPILLAYVYGVVPLSLCRSGGCGVRTTTQVSLVCVFYLI